MTNNKRMAMPKDWEHATTEFLEFKTAAGLAPSSLLTYWRRLRAFAIAIATPPELISQAQLVGYLASRKGIETKRACRNLFTAFFSWFQAKGYRKDDPAASLPRIRKPQPHPRPCTDDMVTEALEQATREERLMLLLAATCGLRRGEIAQVHSADVITGTHGEHSLVVHGKGDKQRIVPLTEELAQEIAAANGYLFPGRWGGHVEDSYIGKHVSRLLPPGYSCHKLRHRFATVAYTDSHDMLAVARALGHSSPDTTQAYVALPEEALRALVEAASLNHNETECITFDGEGNAEKSAEIAENGSIDDTRGHPERRSDGKIIYPYERECCRVEDSADVLCAITFLAWSMTDNMRNGVRSFRMNPTQLAEKWGVGKEYARRSTVVRAAAKKLKSLGVIDLASSDDGFICGNCTVCLELLEIVQESYWREWQEKLTAERR